MLKTKQPNKYGGGSKTNVNGLRFEQSTSLNTILGETGYSVSNNLVSYKDQIIGWSVSKRKLFVIGITQDERCFGMVYLKLNN